MTLDSAREPSVTEATQRGVAGRVADAECGEDSVVTLECRPVAAVVGIDRLTQWAQAEADLRDLALVLARAVGDSGARTSFDDVLAAYGHTRESIAQLPDDE